MTYIWQNYDHQKYFVEMNLEMEIVIKDTPTIPAEMINEQRKSNDKCNVFVIQLTE